MRSSVQRVAACSAGAQEKTGIDVLVHGEPERNDMVPYFAEQLTGYLAGDTARQVALALRETLPLPLRADDRAAYLAWATEAFRLSTSGVRPDIQIHTHMCCAEFGDIVQAIDDLDVDVISLEAARSHIQVARELAARAERRRGSRAAVGEPGLQSEDPRLARDTRLPGEPGRRRTWSPPPAPCAASCPPPDRRTLADHGVAQVPGGRVKSKTAESKAEYSSYPRSSYRRDRVCMRGSRDFCVPSAAMARSPSSTAPIAIRSRVTG